MKQLDETKEKATKQKKKAMRKNTVLLMKSVFPEF